jgi:xanthine dehydrogenase YagT iron-sulfur-binding subunit
MSQQQQASLSRRELLQATAAAGIGAQAVGAQNVAQSSQSGDATTVRFTINGQDHQLQLDPRISLLDVLREQLHLAGTKKGCNQGACGACTVLVDGRRVNSCLMLAVMQNGAEILTIEGLASGGELHPVQNSFIEHDAFQCGYCTPGQILSGVACIREGHAESDVEIRKWMSGNICRCGAYEGIVAAVSQAAKEA